MPLLFAMAFVDLLIALFGCLLTGHMLAAAGALAVSVALLHGSRKLKPGDGQRPLYTGVAWLALGIQILLLVQLAVGFYCLMLACSVENQFSLGPAAYTLASLSLIGQLRGWWLLE